ncbi:hypothetical protein [Nesterenkonia lutea]|uniref:THIF-type NAD/FAD binding fold domain-containing protein n=1 Tax=Nesterenkonia lutea TaxID=272919 RepID=A0ABR9JF42_9MICC|nr:hypothetical protein [Nesterenkonia lutea]MBE1524551.1 hypothetical protein [Nesterenkonia lutea]
MDPAPRPASWQQVFVLDERTVQLGLDEHAVRIIGPAQRTLDRLQSHLAAEGFQVPTPQNATDKDTTDQPDAALAVDQHAAAREIQVRARRRLAAVLLEGLPVAAKLVAEQLTQMQVGMLLLCDERTVLHQDVAAGYPAAAVGLTRAAAVRRACRRHRPEALIVTRAAPRREGLQGSPGVDTATRTGSGGRTGSEAGPGGEREVQPEPVDIHVLFTEGAIAPRQLAEAASRAQAVLPVVWNHADWRIGPLLSQEPGPCPQCLLLHGLGQDPHWEALQIALAGSSHHSSQRPDQHSHDTPGSRTGTRLDPGPESAAVVASLVAREVQLAVDGQHAPQTVARVLCLSGPAGRLSIEPAAPHPECECRLRAADSR